MTDRETVDLLTNFQVHLNEIGLIGNSAWSFEDQAEKFVYGMNEQIAPVEPKRDFGEPVYQLTTKVLVYLDGKAKEFNIGDCFTLAGLKLSTQGDHSPFHYNGDIIRLPNSAVKLYDGEDALDDVNKDFQFNIDNVKVGDTIKILRNSDGSGFDIGEIIKVEVVNQYNIESYNPKKGTTSFVAHCNYEILKEID